MQFAEKNDGGIELRMNSTERRLLYTAVRYFMGNSPHEEYCVDNAPDICNLLNVLEVEPEKWHSQD